MRLTAALLRWKAKPPNGNVWTGKYRLWKAVTPSMTQKKILDYQLEERNLFYLRHPYLTFEQAEGHEEALGYPEKLKEQEIEEEINNWKKHSYLGDRIGFLKIGDKWE